MALLKLDAQVIDESIGTLKRAYNDEVLAAVAAVADCVKNTGDSNKQVVELLDNCKEFQGQYNAQLECVDGFLAEAAKVYDIAEYLDKRATIGTVNKRDTGFQNANIDADTVMI